MSGVSSKSASPTKSYANTARRLSSKSSGDDTPASSKRSSETGQRSEGERVRVFVRVRPPKPEESPGGLKLKQGGKGVVVYREHASIPVSDWDFDKVLGPSSSQSDVYQAAVKPIVEDVLNGYNGTVMAYGQTGAGKTFTLSSIKPDAIGMIPRAAAEVFSAIAQDAVHEYSDLLRPESENLQIRESEGGGVFVSGVQQVEVQSIEQCLHLLQLGDRNRATAFTALNAHSSRSHAVVMLTVIKRKSVALAGPGLQSASTLGLEASASAGPTAEIQRVKVGKLFLVDLAGSERLKKSKSTGLRATEAKSINLSLTTLGMCINARADPNATHVPFRDSKLTRLLQDSLGGNAKTSLVVAVSDAVDHVDESLQSLQFGVRAMCVKIQAVINERVDYRALNSELAAAMEGRDQKSALLERSLLAKESELESMHALLRGEKEANDRILEELRLEREAAEAEKDRLLQERQAQLEAEQQHKQSLLQQLEERHTHTEELRQQHEAQREELMQQLVTYQQQAEEAAQAAQEAALQHELAVEQLQGEARQRQMELQQQHEQAVQHATQQHKAALQEAAESHEQEMLQAAQQHSSEVAALQQEVKHRDERLTNLEQRLASALERAGEDARQAEMRLVERDSIIAGLQKEVASRDEEILRLHDTICTQQAVQAELQHDKQELQNQVDLLEQHCQQLESELSQDRQQIVMLQAQLEAYERSRMALAKSFFENRRVNDAARVIQRAYRAHRNRRLKTAQQQRQQALQDAQYALGSLEQQHAELERRRRANLAFSGQTLVGDSLSVLQEAVEGLITAFLLPARELRTMQNVKQRVSHYGHAKNPLLASMVQPPGSLLSRTSTNPDLIKAINPLAASVANFGVVGTGLSTGSSTPEEGNTPRSALARMFSMSSPFRPKQAAAPSNLGPQLPAVS
ncbi:hypothetical protein N2152v2_008515 [Parachlorella kessleri]